jgi:hypothetical protein
MARLLGLDFGTGGIRIGLYDLESRTMLGEREAAYPTTYPHQGWAEQSPSDWWKALGDATRGLMNDLGSQHIDGICAATTASTVVVCKRDGTPLRPALLWMDCRAAAEASRTEQSTHPVMAYAGGGDASEWLVPKAMWLKTHEPEIYADADVICECLDYVNFMLTGRWVASRMNATCKWNYDSVAQCFHDDLFAEFRVADLGQKLPVDVRPVGASVGPISDLAMAHLGLINKPVVAQGGIDAHMGMVGAGTLAPGDLLLISGTSSVQLFHMPVEKPVPGFWGPYPHALIDDHWLVEAGQVSTGSVLSWFSKRIFEIEGEDFDALIRQASTIPVGGSGLMTLDYFMGNRTPYRDSMLRGAVVGLTLGHDRAALYHSAIEGVALGSAHVIKRIKELGIPCNRIVSAGGHIKNPLWLKATVDAIGQPIEISENANLTIYGTIASAAVGAGLMKDLLSASVAVAPMTRTLYPDLAAHAEYSNLLLDYLQLTDTLAPLSRRLAARQLEAK